MKRLVTPKKVSQATGLPIRTIKMYADKGYIRCVRNPKTKYRLFDLEEVIQDLKKLNVIKNGA